MLKYWIFLSSDHNEASRYVIDSNPDEGRTG